MSLMEAAMGDLLPDPVSHPAVGGNHETIQIHSRRIISPAKTTDPQSPSPDLSKEGLLNSAGPQTGEISSLQAEGGSVAGEDAEPKTKITARAVQIDKNQGPGAMQEAEILADLGREIMHLLRAERATAGAKMEKSSLVQISQDSKSAEAEEEAARPSRGGSNSSSPTKMEEAVERPLKHSIHRSPPQRSNIQVHQKDLRSLSSITAEARSSSILKRSYSKTEKVKGVCQQPDQVQASTSWGRGVESPSTDQHPENWDSSKETREPSRTPWSSSQEDFDGGDWKEVKAPYWWRQEQKAACPPKNEIQKSEPIRGIEKFKQHAYGKCFNCFAPDHQVRHCQAPTRCWRCGGRGHHAERCRSTRQPERYRSAPKSTHAIHPGNPPPRASASRSKRSYLEVARGAATAMAAYPGDPLARPGSESVFVSATGDIRRRRDDLVERAAVCWLRGDNHDSKPHHVADALRSKLGMGPLDFQVVKHFPEQYLVVFASEQLKQRVIRHPRLDDGGRTFNFAAWNETREAVDAKMEFRVYMRLEGIPPHAWGPDVAATILGRSCAIHYVEEHTRRRERTRSYDLWAWCSDPSKIPRRVWLTVSNPDAEQQPTTIPLPQVRVHRDEPTGVKQGLTYKVLPHLEVVEDLSFLTGGGAHGGPPNRKHKRYFIWHYGVEDSQGEVRGHRDGRGREVQRRRDDYDEDQGGRNRRRRSASAWARTTRCRNGAADCYSTNVRAFNRSYGGSFRSRQLKWIPKNTSQSKLKDAKVTPAPPSSSKPKKHVSFANPVAVVFGDSPNATWSKQAEEAGTDLMLSKKTDVAMMLMKKSLLMTHLDNPINKKAMEALQVLVDHGTKMEKKKGAPNSKEAVPMVLAA